jgi:hypothetical protein
MHGTLFADFAFGAQRVESIFPSYDVT